MKDAHDTASMAEVEDIEGKPAATHEALAATYVPGTDEEKKLEPGMTHTAWPDRVVSGVGIQAPPPVSGLQPVWGSGVSLRRVNLSCWTRSTERD